MTLLEQMSKERTNRNAARMKRTQDRCVDTDTDTRKLSYSDAIRHLQVNVTYNLKRTFHLSSNIFKVIIGCKNIHLLWIFLR